MKKETSIIESVKSNYTVAVMGALGVLAFVSAFVIAWPALSYLGIKIIS